MSGIDFERLVNKEQYKNFFELIKCKICCKILINPYDCTKCGNTFCYQCITDYINEHHMCPFKCENSQINQSSLSITSYLNNLNFYCVNRQNGCQEEINYTSLNDHDKNCKYFYAVCPNKQCGKKIQWKLIENHLRNECEFTKFPCVHCGNLFYRNEMKIHYENCVNVGNSIKYSINNKTEEEIQNDKKIFNGIMNALPEIRVDEENNSNNKLLDVLKSMMFYMKNSNEALVNEMKEMKKEMKNIKEDFDAICKNNMIFFESINSELETIGNKLNSSDFYNSNETLTTLTNEDKRNNSMNDFSITKNSSSSRKKLGNSFSAANPSTSAKKKVTKKNTYSPKRNPNPNPTFSGPSARPFNTFTSYTNSNLVNIINNQEVIINKLKELEKKIETEHVVLNEIRMNDDNVICERDEDSEKDEENEGEKSEEKVNNSINVLSSNQNDNNFLQECDDDHIALIKSEDIGVVN